MSDIQRERDQNSKAFQKELPKLKALRGKYFLMKGGKIINFYDTLEDAYSTGTTFYDDRMFSVFALKGPKQAAGKKPAKKRVSKKKSGTRRTARATNRMAGGQSKTDVPGYDPNYPDQGPTQFEDAAYALRIKPFYSGANARPFECLEATLTWTTSYRGTRATTGWHNDFRLTEACRWGHARPV
jgi:hypothetical protein